MPVELLKWQQYLAQNTDKVSPVVDFNKSSDNLFPFDFTSANTELSPEVLNDTELFSLWISSKLKENNCRYGIGGYNEHRTIYSRSGLFNMDDKESRRLHLGTDIWGEAGTPVYCPLDGLVHSYNFNDNFGDYGATIILQHTVGELSLYSLYGHLNLSSLSRLTVGMPIAQGEQLARFGNVEENGHWPPHLHFQLIVDMKTYQGDYPGVCAFSENELWLENSPDPALLLQYTF